MIDKLLNLSTLDRVFITTNVALHKFSSSAERSLQRYEFMEIIVRLANAKFKDNNVCLTSKEAIGNLPMKYNNIIDKFVNEHILAFSESVEV